MLTTITRRHVSVQDFDRLVVEIYGRPYSFQQQDGCRMRGVEVVVPATPEDHEATTCEERTNCGDYGVSFEAWLARDPEQVLPDREYHDFLKTRPKADADRFRRSSLVTWWERHHYPHVSMVLNDLYERGLLEAGEYSIDIGW